MGSIAVGMAAEVKIRAERGGGQLLRDDLGFGRGKKSATIANFGIDHHASKRWQAIARIPENDFERHIAETIALRHHDRGWIQGIGRPMSYLGQSWAYPCGSLVAGSNLPVC